MSGEEAKRFVGWVGGVQRHPYSSARIGALECCEHCHREHDHPAHKTHEPSRERHVVMLSGGVGSWATARRVAAKVGTDGLVMLFADTQEEDADTYRFLRDGAANVGGTLVELAEGRDVWTVFRDVRYLGNTRIDPCSRVLKRELMRKWVDENCDPENTTVYIGMDWTEPHRIERQARFWHPYRVECPLAKPPYLTKEQMHDWAEAEGLPRQSLYREGFGHANCGGFCVKAGQAQFALLLRVRPERYAYHERKEQELRDYLDKDVAILRDRRILNGREIVRPLTMREFRERLEAQPNLFDAEEWGACSCTDPQDDELRAA